MGRPIEPKVETRCAHCARLFVLRYAYQKHAHATGQAVCCSCRCANRFKATYRIGLRTASDRATARDFLRAITPGRRLLAIRAARLYQTGLLNYAEIARALQIGNCRSERGRWYVRHGLALLRKGAEEGMARTA